MGVVVVVAPLERVRPVDLGHIIPEFDHDVIRSVRGADPPGRGSVVEILDREIQVAVGPVGYADPLIFPTRRLSRNAVALWCILKCRIRPVILAPIVATRVKAVQPRRGESVVVAEAINIRAVVSWIARKWNRQRGSPDTCAEVLLSRAAEEKGDLLPGRDHLVRLDAVLVVRKLRRAIGDRIIANVRRVAGPQSRNVRLKRKAIFCLDVIPWSALMLYL